MTPIRSALAAVAVLFIAAPALAPAQEARVPAEAYAEVNAALVKHHVMPRYQRLVTATVDLSKASEGLCSGGEAAGLDAARARYHETMDAWMGVQHLRFGPVELFMRAFRLYFWPESQDKVAEAVRKLLAKDDPGLFAPDRFRNTSVAVQGLPALEYLLYGSDTIAPGSKHCGLLTAIAANMRDMAAAIVADWQGSDADFAGMVSAPGPDNRYFATHKDATLAFFKSFHGGLQALADIKLKPVFGDSIGAARPRLVESRLSERALRNIVVNLAALEALYRGEGGAGLGELVRKFSSDAELDPLMRKAFRITRETARAIEGPLAEAVRDPGRRPEVEKLLTQVLALKQIVRTRLAAALELQVGFNALDGD